MQVRVGRLIEMAAGVQLLKFFSVNQSQYLQTAPPPPPPPFHRPPASPQFALGSVYRSLREAYVNSIYISNRLPFVIVKRLQACVATFFTHVHVFRRNQLWSQYCNTFCMCKYTCAHTNSLQPVESSLPKRFRLFIVFLCTQACRGAR